MGVPVATGAMTAVGEGPTGAGTGVAAAPQPARMTATSAERRTRPAGRRRAWVGITGPLARDADRGDAWTRVRGHGRAATRARVNRSESCLSLIHISEPTRLGMISYAVFC